jgi:GT2 family glycosyltransferase
MDGLFSIVILSWNRPSLLRSTVNSLMEKTKVPNELIISDNASDNPELLAYLDTIKGNDLTTEVKVIHNPRNYGVAWGKNVGIYHSKGDWVLLSDDDIEYPDHYAEQLIEIHEKVPRVGVAGVCVEPLESKIQTIGNKVGPPICMGIVPGAIIRVKPNEYPIEVINGVRCRPKRESNLGGATLTLSRRVLDRIGYLKGGVYGMDDSNLSVRLKCLGLMSVYAESYGVHKDEDRLKPYRAAKDRAHLKGSPQLTQFIKDKTYYESTGNVYVPFDLTILDREDPIGVQTFTNELLK